MLVGPRRRGPRARAALRGGARRRRPRGPARRDVLGSTARPLAARRPGARRRGGRRGPPRARPRRPRLRAEVRVPHRGGRALRRHRLGAHRLPRRRRARRRERARGGDAVALQLRPLARGRAPRSPGTSASAFQEISIEPMHAAFLGAARGAREGTPLGDLAEQNVQARIRGQILMALSNDTGGLVLSTGNKSELAVGYCTLYGDMAGGLAVIGDVPKTLVYRVSRAANARAGRTLIPERTFTKPPSAELKPGQVDQDSLPPYEVLDDILAGLRRGAAPARRDRRARPRRGHRPARAADGRRERVQAAAGGAGAEGEREGVRRGPALPNRARVPVLIRHLDAR